MPNRVAIVLLLGLWSTAVPATHAQTRPELQDVVFDGGNRVVKSIAGKRVALNGRAVVVVRGSDPKLGDGEFHFSSSSPDASVEFEQVRPSVVQRDYLGAFFVDDEPAVHGENVRLVPKVTGAIVVPHGPDYEALLAYRSPNLAGDPRGCVVHKYYKSAELGEDEDQIESFTLRKGYMATLAEHENGTGASQVFIARDRDLSVKRLPEGLRGKVSFIRVFPWRYTGKKGYAGNLKPTQALDARWFYDWGAGKQSTLDIEYVPMRHNAHWDSFKKINALENVTHLLGFNEPNQRDQANMTVEQALALWPKLQASGLRLGSPSPNDAQRGLDWLYKFMDEADKRGYRVDFVAVHYYKADWSDKQMIGWLHEIHKRTGGRPIWLTEFNNGAPWTKNHNPTYAENARKLDEYCRIMDAADFVERYAIFNLGPDSQERQLIRGGELTPAGKWYRRYVGEEAYTEKTRSRRR